MKIVLPPLFVKILLPGHFSGIALFPFIFMEKKEFKKDLTFINHEKIHLRQQAELLVIFFLIIYALEFIYYLLKYKKALQAYRSVSFEREAYEHETNYNYLKTRKWLSFIKYWKTGQNLPNKK